MVRVDLLAAEAGLHETCVCEVLIEFADAERGVRISLVRLSPSVHGDGDHDFVSTLMNNRTRKVVAAYVGDGVNRWNAVHRLDAAHLFRLAFEKATPGTRFHGVVEEGIAFRNIAEVIGQRLNLRKTFSLREGKQITFGAEAFNLLNHPNFAVPSNTQSPLTQGGNGDAVFKDGAGDFANNPGRIFTTIGTARQIQLAARFVF
jgi:hypothetical protein